MGGFIGAAESVGPAEWAVGGPEPRGSAFADDEIVAEEHGRAFRYDGAVRLDLDAHKRPLPDRRHVDVVMAQYAQMARESDDMVGPGKQFSENAGEIVELPQDWC